jgi:CRP-like cAMP-binding protein
MGLCASSDTRAASGSSSTADQKYKAGGSGETKEQLSPRQSNVIEKKTETALAAAKARRLVVADVGGFERDESFVCPVYEKTKDQISFLNKSLKENFFMFQDLEQSSQVDMVGAMESRTVQNNEELMKQGDNGEHMFVIEKGTFDVVLSGKVVKQCQSAEVVGELALIYQAPRAASVVCTATSGATVWALDRTVFRNLIARVAASKVDEFNNMLMNYPLFQGLDESVRSGLTDVMVPVHFKQGETIVQQGDEGNTFYIIKSGSVTCTDESDKGSDIQLAAGGYFGELALINNNPRARSVLAREETEVLALGRKDFQNILGSVKETLRKEAGYRVLKTCEIFPGHLSSSVRDNICEAFELRTSYKDANIVVAGDIGHTMFVIGEGEAQVLVEGNVVREIRYLWYMLVVYTRCVYSLCHYQYRSTYEHTCSDHGVALIRACLWILFFDVGLQ